MNVRCTSCETVFRVDPVKVPAKGVRARCSVCSGVFWVRHEVAPTPIAEAPVETPRAEPVAPPAAPPTVAEVRPVEPVVAEPLRAVVPPVAPPPIVAKPADTPLPPLVLPPIPPRREPPPPPAPPAPGQLAPPAFGGSSPQRAPSRPAPAPFVPPAVPTPVSPPAAPAAVSRVGSAAPPASVVEVPKAGLPAVRKGRPNPFLSQDPSAKARRLARALISDMVVYHPAKRREGIQNGSLKQLFEEEIKKSWEEYVDQVGRGLAESTPFFNDALNEILADGRVVFP